MVRMKPGESLKQYFSYFSSQKTLVYNCNENVVAATFISRLQVTNSFYKQLVKKDINKMRDILIQAQKCMQIEEATWGATSRATKQGSEVKKPQQQFPR